MLSKFIFMLIWSALGQANYQQSREYIERDEQHNSDLIKGLFPFIQWTMIVMSYARLLLVLLSMKKLAICKVYIYYQIVYLMLEQCLPRDYGDMQLKVLMNQTVLDFSLLYFKFWPSCIGVLTIQLF